MENGFDISASEDSSATSTTPEALTDTPEAPVTDSALTQSQEEKPDQPYVPFSSGKEKFKVGQKELEWDWDTTKRYAQKGYAGMQALERAAQVEKQAKSAYQQLMQAAQNDPEGLIRILNPTWQGFGGKAAQPNKAVADESDPREATIKALEQKLGSVEEVLERQEIEKERQAVQAELDSAIKAYPILDSEINREYVKAQYRKALQNGIQDITIDDVAFHVAQKLQEERMSADQKRLEKVRQNKKVAPVTAVPGGTGNAKQMTREEVMRLAGRIV